MSGPPRWNVFLSSTVRDLEAYRRGVKEALNRAEVECYPSEDWVNSSDDTEAVCRRKFEAANSYLLLLGYWYGSVLPERNRTVTQVEYRWALDRAWPTVPPPRAVLVPKPGSTADMELRTAAQRLKEVMADEAFRFRHDELVDAWHREVLDSWRTVNQFSDMANLRETVVILLREWDPGALLALAREARSQEPTDVSHLSDPDLGLLCRVDQIRAIQRSRAEVAADPSTPAIALLIHGDRDSAGNLFLQRLVAKVLKRPSRCHGSLQASCTDPTLVTATIAQLLGLGLTTDRTPKGLADLVVQELRARPLAFILERCALYPGGSVALEGEFWMPFYAALRAAHAEQPAAHRLTAVFTDFSGKAALWLSTREQPPVGARERFLEVPPLGPFTRSGIHEGLEELRVAAGLRNALIERAMKDEAGDDDPAPIRAIERLRTEPIQFEGDDA